MYQPDAIAHYTYSHREWNYVATMSKLRTCTAEDSISESRLDDGNLSPKAYIRRTAAAYHANQLLSTNNQELTYPEASPNSSHHPPSPPFLVIQLAWLS